MTEPLLKVNNLSIGFKTEGAIESVVTALNYELHSGETLAIVGESGSGKSVSSLAVLGLLPKQAVIQSGAICLAGENILNMDSKTLRTIRGAKISMIFQEPMTALTPVLSIGEQLIEGIQCHQSVSYSQAFELATQMLRVTRIPEPAKRMKQYPHQLSGGMRQRVMIAMALACKPLVLIADEPTTALDVTIQAQILTLMKTLQQTYGTAIIIVTHDMGVVAETADRVMVMRKGVNVETGTVNQVLSHPQHEYTQALLSAVPVLGTQQNNFSKTCSDKPVQPLLSIERLCVNFPLREGVLKRHSGNIHAVDQASFSLNKGETLALVGESGSGKSTLGRAVLNLVPITSGSVLFRGQDITNLNSNTMRPLRKNMQMIFQDPMASLNPRMKVGKLVAEPMTIHSSDNARDIYKKTVALFERVGLTEKHMQRYPSQFSGGQRQRIVIARALATRPSLIIADECVSALDVSVQADIIELMKSLQNEFSISYLFISHDLAVVEQISHRVAVMRAGQIVEIGETQAVLHRAQHEYTQRLIAAVPSANPSLATLTKRPLIEGEVPSAVRAVNYIAPDRVMHNVSGSSDHYVIADGIQNITAEHAS